MSAFPLPPGFGAWELFWGMTTFCSAYLAFYLGVGRLAMIGINRLLSASAAGYEVHVQGAPLISLVVHVALLGLGTIGPLILHALLGIREYTALQATNPFWTIAAMMMRPTFSEAILAISPIVIAAAALFIFNVVIAAKSIVVPREATPARVRDDDVSLGRPANSNSL